MEEFFQQTSQAAIAGMYFLALTGALIIPDMCAALESADGETDGRRYRAWFDTHAADHHARGGTKRLTGADCWNFRCALLHQGRTDHERSHYERIAFVEPKARGDVYRHMVVHDDVLFISVQAFTLDMVRAAVHWQNGVAGTEPYESNLKRFVSRHPGGWPPVIEGAAVIT